MLGKELLVGERRVVELCMHVLRRRLFGILALMMLSHLGYWAIIVYLSSYYLAN